MRRDNLDRIYRSYMHDIYIYLFSLCNDQYLAEDLVQETFFRAYIYLEDCKSDRIKPWLLKVAHNTLIDHWRKNKRSRPTEEDFFLTLHSTDNPEDHYIKKEQLEEVSLLISGLPQNQKQAILLYDFYDLTYQEAAEIMNIKLGHFKVLLFRARQKIRQNKEMLNGDE